MKIKLDGKKVNVFCIGAIVANVILAFCGIMPCWVTILSGEAALIIMALRSTARKIDGKLRDIQERGVNVEKNAIRFVR